jgi:hypothetical protein
MKPGARQDSVAVGRKKNGDWECYLCVLVALGTFGGLCGLASHMMERHGIMLGSLSVRNGIVYVHRRDSP